MSHIPMSQIPMSQIPNVANPQCRNPHRFPDLSRVVQVSKWLSSIGGWQAIWWGADYFQAPARRCPPIHRGVSSSIPLPRISLSVCPTCLPLPAPINPVLRGKFRLLFFHCLCANSFGFPPYVCHISNSWRLTPVQSWKMKMVSGHHSSHGNDSILIAIVVTLGLTGRARNQYDYNKGNENDVLPAL